MRKFVLSILLILTCVILFLVILLGVKIGNFKLIDSYSDIETVSALKKTLLLELNDKNQVEFEQKKVALNSAVKEYQAKKDEYDRLVVEGKLEDIDAFNSVDLIKYDLDFLWTVIGNYATQNGVTIDLNFTKSANQSIKSSEYVICNLNFTITGDYIALTDFISNIEDDDQLSFEISNFLLEKGGENLQATFTVKDIPISSSNLSNVPSSAQPVYNEIINTDNSSN